MSEPIDDLQFRKEHNHLLTAQVVLTDRLNQLVQAVAESKKDCDERFKATDMRLNALIKVVDKIIRRPS